MSAPITASSILLLAFAPLLTGCEGMPGQPDPSISPASTPTGPAAESPADAPTDSETALAAFSSVTARVWDSDARDEGRAYIDALQQVGFSKEAMQVTADRTTVGNPVESLQFSVAWNDTECLVGQVGPSTGEPVAALMPRLADGACLAGQTRPIDW